MKKIIKRILGVLIGISFLPILFSLLSIFVYKPFTDGLLLGLMLDSMAIVIIITVFGLMWCFD